MYRYETHLHTWPVSRCAQVGVEESLKLYKELGYDGVFITNHFLDGNINIDGELPYAEKIAFYFSDYERGREIGEALGIKVFCGVELSYKATDFLIYGLDKAWYLAHPEIMDMEKHDELLLMQRSCALVIQAHPFREPGCLNHVRLYPRNVHGVETINANRSSFENKLAAQYAENYCLLPFGGSDNHFGRKAVALAGMESQTPVTDEQDFVRKVLQGKMKPFHIIR